VGVQWSEDVRAQHLSSFGEVLGPLYTALSSDVLWLHIKWLEYRELYAGSSERIRLLNDSAPNFFGMLQSILWHDVLLHIARLTDPPRQPGGENLTLLSLPEVLDDTDLQAEVETKLDCAVAAANFARQYRNKHLAHRDLDHALERAEPLTQGSRQQVEEVLGLFVEALNTVNNHYCEATQLYREMMPLGDARSILSILALARDVESKRRARIEAGTFTAEDWERPQAP
jgi:hypothetical protein